MPRSSHRSAVAGACLVPFLLLLGACSNSPSNNQSQSATSAPSSNSGAATGQIDAVRACEADFKVLEVALEAYNATNGSFPAPPAPWSSSDYAANFGPLLSKNAKGGPYLTDPLVPADYVIEYDSQGHVWIEPAGKYDQTFNSAHVASDKTCQTILH